MWLDKVSAEGGSHVLIIVRKLLGAARERRRDSSLDFIQAKPKAHSRAILKLVILRAKSLSKHDIFCKV